MATKKAGPVLTAERKEAMASGRAERRAVQRYLEALEAAKPRRGRQRTREAVETQIARIEAELSNGVDPMSRLLKVQARNDLQAELAGFEPEFDMEEIQADFIKYVGPFSEKKGIGYSAWREVGVPPAVLKAGGVRVTRA